MTEFFISSCITIRFYSSIINVIFINIPIHYLSSILKFLNDQQNILNQYKSKNTFFFMVTIVGAA